jgi:hypothetical protein
MNTRKSGGRQPQQGQQGRQQQQQSGGSRQQQQQGGRSGQMGDRDNDRDSRNDNR